MPLDPQPQTDTISQNTTVSDPSNMPPSVPESPEAITTPEVVNSDNQDIESLKNPIISTEPEKTLENQAPVSEPKITPENLEITTTKSTTSVPAENPTAQIPVSEPLSPEPEPIKPEPEKIPEVKPIETKPEPEKIPEVKPIETKPEPIAKPKPEVIIPAVTILSQTKNIARELLVKARNAIQTRKRKKLNQIMTLFAKRTKITNDEVEKLLHVSDATATRYLNILQKEGKIKQTGKTGKSVFYSKI